MESELQRLLAAVRPLDEAAMEAARSRQSRLAKPPGSLGKLEEISVRLSGITGRVHNRLDHRRILVLCADNGVVEEGVASAPQSVTAAQAVNMTRGKTGMSALASWFGDEVQVVDMGIACPYECPAILDRKIAQGTQNIRYGAAMTREQALRAILTGAALAAQAQADGIQGLGTGEMGIGNTTTSAAVLSALTGAPVETVTGRGGGITDESFARKKQVIAESLRRNAPDAADPVDVLAKVGGFDLAALCGVFLGAARCRIPVVIDGFISVVAALCAARLCPAAAEYCFPSHASYERGYALAARELGLSPWLLLDMRLGEGSGCPLAFQVMAAACAAMNGMATFEDAAINDGYLDEIRAKDSFTV